MPSAESPTNFTQNNKHYLTLASVHFLHFPFDTPKHALPVILVNAKSSIILKNPGMADKAK